MSNEDAPAEPEELALWRALRKAVTEEPGLGVTAIGPKPQTVMDDVRIEIAGSGRQWNVILEEVREP